jgi:uncharacterized membrane protein
MRQKNRGGIFISFIGLIGILIFIAGLSMVLASQCLSGVCACGTATMILGGFIVFEMWKTQKNNSKGVS